MCNKIFNSIINNPDHKLYNLLPSTSKCKVMHFSRKKMASAPMVRTFSVPCTLDLGVTMANDLSWSRHIGIIVSKANKTLDLVKSVCRDLEDVNTKKLLYCAIVRPKLEYGSNLWSPYTIKYCSVVENVERRATKFILNYPRDMSYTERLVKINLLPLDLRREICDLLKSQISTLTFT